MKRITCLALVVLIICALICGCATSSTQDQNYQSVPTGGQYATNPTTNEREIIDLTVDNINEYIAFSTDLSDPDLYQIVNVKLCDLKLTVKTASKQKVEFKNLKISFKMVPVSSSVGYGWDRITYDESNTEFNPTMEIPYNGIWEDVYVIQSEAKEYVSDDPNLKLVVTAVSGQAIIE